MSVFAVTGEFNGLAVAIFAVVLAVTLLITRWAAARTKTTTEFYTAGRGISGAQERPRDRRRLPVGVDVPGLRGPDVPVRLRRLDHRPRRAHVVHRRCSTCSPSAMRNSGKFTLADVLSFRLQESPRARRGGDHTLLVTGIYLIAQLVGAGALVQALAGIDFAIAVLICGVFMTIYVVFGGMLATTWVQIIKAGMLMTAGVIVSVAVMAKFGFSPSQLLDKAAAESGEGQTFLGPGLYLDVAACW